MPDRQRQLATMLRRQELKKKAVTEQSSLTPAQLRAARSLLNWSQSTLAARVDVTDATISGFEVGRTTLSAQTLTHIHTVLEKAGISLIRNGVSRHGEGAAFRF